MRVKNWKKFQHFSNRKPPWIKVYRDILDDHEWHNLDGHSAKVLVMLWLLASEYENGELPPIHVIAFRLRLPEKVAKTIVSNLSHWLEQDDITAISPRYQSDPLEIEGETEKETEGEGARRKRRSTIPEDFSLSESMREYALKRYPDMDTAATFADFKDHHTNKGTLGLDWEAGWRTWVNKAERMGYARAKRRETVSGPSRKISHSEFLALRKQNGLGTVQPGVVGSANGPSGEHDAQSPQARRASA